MNSRVVLLLIISVITLSCNDGTVKNNSIQGNNPKVLYDGGEDYFMNHCISCHHVMKKDGFVWPSVSELSKMDSLKRNSLLDNVLKDSIHANIVKNISKEDFFKIRYFINAK